MQREPSNYRSPPARRGRPTKSPLSRIRNGLVVLGGVFAIAVVGFRILGNYDWVTAFWMTAITISSVGFSETTDSSPALQLFTVGVIVFGMSAAAYTFGGFVQMVLEGELDAPTGAIDHPSLDSSSDRVG